MRKENPEIQKLIRELEDAMTQKYLDWDMIENLAEKILKLKEGHYLPAYGALRMAARGNKQKLIAINRRVLQFFPENIDATIFLAEQTEDITRQQLENVSSIIQQKLTELNNQTFSDEYMQKIEKKRTRLQNNLQRVERLLEKIPKTSCCIGTKIIERFQNDPSYVFTPQDYSEIIEFLREGQQLEGLDKTKLAQRCFDQNNTPGLICGLAILKTSRSNEIRMKLKSLQKEEVSRLNQTERALVQDFSDRSTITFVNWKELTDYFSTLNKTQGNIYR